MQAGTLHRTRLRAANGSPPSASTSLTNNKTGGEENKRSNKVVQTRSSKVVRTAFRTSGPRKTPAGATQQTRVVVLGSSRQPRVHTNIPSREERGPFPAVPHLESAWLILLLCGAACQLPAAQLAPCQTLASACGHDTADRERSGPPRPVSRGRPAQLS